MIVEVRRHCRNCRTSWRMDEEIKESNHSSWHWKDNQICGVIENYIYEGNDNKTNEEAK